MTPRDLRNIHTTGNGCEDALLCMNIALKLPQYFYLLMVKLLMVSKMRMLFSNLSTSLNVNNLSIDLSQKYVWAGPFRRFSTCMWQNVHVNTIRHVMVCNVYFPFPKIWITLLNGLQPISIVFWIHMRQIFLYFTY